MSKPTLTARQRLKLVAFSLIPAAVLLFAAQVYASVRIYRDVSVEPDPLGSGGAVYRMHFGRWGFGQVTHTPLNALGLPDDEYSSIGPKGDCIHVVFSGDSFTFGDAVDRHRNFVSLVKRAIAREHPSRCIRVFNIGERMTTIQEQSARIRQTRPILQPDIVILSPYQNDITDLTNPGNAANSGRSSRSGAGTGSTAKALPTALTLVSHSDDGAQEAVADSAAPDAAWWGDVVRERVPFSNAALIRWLSYRAFAFMVTNNLRYDILAQWSVLADSSNVELANRLTGIYREMFVELVDELRRDGTEVGVVILPSKLDLLAGRSPEQDFFVKLAQESGVPFLTTYEALDANRRDYPYQMFDGHLSESGNAVVAREIYRWLDVGSPSSPFRQLGEPASSQAPFTP